MTSDRAKTNRPNDAEITEALLAAANALDEMALEKALAPDAEHARDLCHDLLDRMVRVGKSSSLDAAIQKAASNESDRETDQLSKDQYRD